MSLLAIGTRVQNGAGRIRDARTGGGSSSDGEGLGLGPLGRAAALPPGAEELVGHRGTEGVQAADGARGAGRAASHPGLLERVARGGHGALKRVF